MIHIVIEGAEHAGKSHALALIGKQLREIFRLNAHSGIGYFNMHKITLSKCLQRNRTFFREFDRIIYEVR